MWSWAIASTGGYVSIIQSRWSKTDRRLSHFVVIWGDRSHLRRLRSSPIDVRSSGYGRRSSHDGEDFGECEEFIKHFVFNRTYFLASIRNLK